MNENENEKLTVAERARQIGEKVRESFAKLNRRTKIILLALLLAAAAGTVWLVRQNQARPYAVLFTDLNSEDMSQVLTYLDSNNISDYKVENNNRILVPQGQEYRLKMAILQEGFPKSGFGYQLYLTNVSALSSDSDRQLLWQADLQERLASTIRYIPGVRNAQVFITLGEDRRFILSTDDVITATASVFVEMAARRTLTDQQAAAIRNLVSHAVQGLKIDEVEISDTEGNTYMSVDDNPLTSSNDSAQLRLSLESQINAYVRKSVLSEMEMLFGTGNVSVSVHSAVDMRRRYEESTIYENPEWADDAASGEGIIGRRIWGTHVITDQEGAVGGVPGTTTNSDFSEYVINPEDLDGSERYLNAEGQIDYNVTERRVQMEEPLGTLTDLTVSVVINSNVVDFDSMDVPTLRHVIATAAGIQQTLEEEKVGVMTYPFYVTPEPEPQPLTFNIAGIEIPGWVVYALIAGAVLFVILLVVIILIRRALRKRREERLAQKAAEEAALAALAAAEEEEEVVDYVLVELAEGEEPEEGEEVIIGEDGKRYVRRKRVTKRKKPKLEEAAEETPEETQEEEAPPAETEEPAGEGADIMDMHTERGMALVRDVRQFVEENPAIAAQLLKTWLRGGEDGNA